MHLFEENYEVPKGKNKTGCGVFIYYTAESGKFCMSLIFLSVVEMGM